MIILIIKLFQHINDVDILQSLDNAREKIETWRRDYNEFRPHSVLDNMTPEEYVKKHLKTPEISNLRGTAFG